MRIASCLIVVGLLVTGCRVSDARKQQHVESFDRVWQTVHEKHYDPTFGGVDWNAVRDELRPKVLAATSDEQAREIMQDMLSRLKLSHFAVASGNAKPDSKPSHGKFVPPIASKAPSTTVTFGNLPPMPLRYTYVRLQEEVGYFYLSIFIEPGMVMPAFRQGVEDARTCKGFILDLRHNPGGIGGMAMGMGNEFVDKPDQKLGTMIQRETELKFVLNPQADPYTKPLAILIDEGSASTTEILAGGLKDLHRARIFGTRSAGMALPSLVEKLPNGDIFQFAVANYISTGGKPLEGAGVTPDEVVEYKEPYNTPDPVLAAAVKWIKSQSEKK